jgi:hypothetical protein
MPSLSKLGQLVLTAQTSFAPIEAWKDAMKSNVRLLYADFIQTSAAPTLPSNYRQSGS